MLEEREVYETRATLTAWAILRAEAFADNVRMKSDSGRCCLLTAAERKLTGPDVRDAGHFAHGKLRAGISTISDFLK